MSTRSGLRAGRVLFCVETMNKRDKILSAVAARLMAAAASDERLGRLGGDGGEGGELAEIHRSR